ncbi:hypothetical protein ACGF5C_31590 [Micromonospora sp. NPDC047620]|uniref:hypothetical protein n=1 Tax=Micromonospora sp. NPDC047620 TaxID=3364251 RepID=UPI00370F9ADB
MNDFVEALGYALIVAFLYLVWAPLALLGGGLLLVVWANVREKRPAGQKGRTAAALGAAWGAARRAYRAQQELPDGPPVRRIA